MTNVPVRHDWVDVAKAASIVLVVAHHVGAQASRTILPGVASPWVTVWFDLNTVFGPVRMPLFFLVSGLLAAGAVARPWSSALRGRLSHQLWPYALWTMPFALLWVYAIVPTDKRSWFFYNLEMLPLGGRAYWYLYALALFFVVAKLGRRVPGLVLVVSAALLLHSEAIADLLGTGEPQSNLANVTRWTMFGFWFLLGCYARPLVLQVAAASTPLTAGVAAAAYGWSATGLFLRDEIPGTAPVVTLIGLAAAVLCSVQLARVPQIARLGQLIGRRTLTIYLVHPFLIQFCTLLVDGTGGSRLVEGPVWAQASWVPVWTVVLTAAAIGFDVACRRSGARWLLEPPDWLVGRREVESRRPRLADRGTTQARGYGGADVTGDGRARRGDPEGWVEEHATARMPRSSPRA